MTYKVRITIGALILASALACDKSTIKETYDGVGTVTGRVLNGATGVAISGATVTSTGLAPEQTATTGSDGVYTMSNIPSLSFVLTAAASTYTSDAKTVTVAKNQTTIQDFQLLQPSYTTGKYVIVLGWGVSPLDLDAHLYVPDTTPSSEILYNNKGDNDGTLDSAPFAGLDVDDTSSYGPETIAIKKTGTAPYYSGTYRFFVYNFSQETTFSPGVTVKVYDEGTLVKTYVSYVAAGNYWYVFDLSSTGVFTDINTVQATKPAKPQ